MVEAADALVFFGATGDLAYKKIFPALYAMAKRNKLDFRVIGQGRKPFSREQLIERARASVAESQDLDPRAFDRLAQKLDYVICFPDRCVAEVPLSDQLVSSFKKGSELTLTSVNFQNQQNPVKVTLKGFTGAYDGPPLQQADIEDRQKKLQDFVAKNNEDFAKKLKEEQDKAKAAN